MILYRSTDRIPVKVGEVQFWISPLTFAQRAEIAGTATMRSGNEQPDSFKAGMLTLKYSIKAVEGIKTADGDDYQLTLENGTLTQQSVDDLMNMAILPKLMEACSLLMSEIKEHAIDGVVIDLKGVRSEKKA